MDHARHVRLEIVKIRESGMPAERFWESLFDVGLILRRLGIDAGLGDVAELGCGYGTFTVAVAERISGTLHAFDIDPAMVTRTRRRAAEAGLKNVIVQRRDVLVRGFGLPSLSLDGCLLFNILHHDEPVALLDSAARALRPGGRLFIVHWRHDPDTPRGPGLRIRPHPEQVERWATQTGLLEPSTGVVDLPPWHYGLVFGTRSPRDRERATTGA
jgi:SAM-dependent methyltransferase